MSNQTTPELDSLTDLYHSYENRLSVVPAPEDNSLKKLVTFDNSKNAPVHRWFTFKEGYSKDIISELENRKIISQTSQNVILDPFCGVATTLLSTHTKDDNSHIKKVVGVERNPAILAIARAKLNWHSYNIETIRKILNDLKTSEVRKKSDYTVPSLSTFSAIKKNGKRAFDPETLQDLIFYREWIKENCSGTPEYDFFMLAWTSIIEEASYTRKDGRALRLLNSTSVSDVKMLLMDQCREMIVDLEGLDGKIQNAKNIFTQAIRGDARSLPFGCDTFTALCYSPPYLNNIDYTEVYKLELWLREEVLNQEQFYSIRKGTFRSHPSINFAKSSFCDNLAKKSWIHRLKTSILKSLPEDVFKEQRKKLFAGYIDDMLITLAEQLRVATPGAPIICVVGNSLHGGKNNPTVPVCTDLLISAAAESVGLKVDHLQIARQLPRRDNKNGWLRETIIVMRKPKKRQTA